MLDQLKKQFVWLLYLEIVWGLKLILEFLKAFIQALLQELRLLLEIQAKNKIVVNISFKRGQSLIFLGSCLPLLTIQDFVDLKMLLFGVRNKIVHISLILMIYNQLFLAIGFWV